MSEWEVIGVIIALTGFFIAVVKPIVKLNTSITTLSTIMNAMSEDLKSLTNDNKESHRRLWKHNNEQDATLNDHEHRLTVIETKQTHK